LEEGCKHQNRTLAYCKWFAANPHKFDPYNFDGFLFATTISNFGAATFEKPVNQHGLQQHANRCGVGSWLSYVLSVEAWRYNGLVIYRCLLLFLLLFAHIPGLVTAQLPSSMTSKSVGFNKIDYSEPFHNKHAFRRMRVKKKFRDRHPWTPDLITYVCEELTDPCVRASFLRRHVEHEICFDTPPLYLLPHIDGPNNAVGSGYQSPPSSSQLCDTKEVGVRRSDGLYRKYLETPERCRQSLEALDAKIRSTLNQDLNNFLDILKRSFCILANSTDDTMQEECEQCRVCYHLLYLIIT
uniref:Uncharacterized protein n=1 Tax=Rodentolepis nana TaxID=102285 RepID=A0A0R3TU63_RODNA